METVNDDEVNMMIEMADKDKKGGVNLEDFIDLMK
jgi:Ca2+-binding EF-hand superfamily protein